MHLHSPVNLGAHLQCLSCHLQTGHNLSEPSLDKGLGATSMHRSSVLGRDTSGSCPPPTTSGTTTTMLPAESGDQQGVHFHSHVTCTTASLSSMGGGLLGVQLPQLSHPHVSEGGAGRHGSTADSVRNQHRAASTSGPGNKPSISLLGGACMQGKARGGLYAKLKAR